MTTAIQEEPQRKPKSNEVGGQCIFFNLRKAARVITHVYDEALRPTGYRATQLSLLAATNHLGPVTVNRLADTVVMDRTTLTRNLKPLEKQGLLKVRVGEDRRERVVVLTEKGRKLMQRVQPLIQRTQDKVKSAIGDDCLDRLLKDLSSALTAVREP